ncbi:TetR/AcrR family transcriptional regulator [Spirochaeta africana]|uniref:Transcriptional regulator n=1 Tax=Spirochaeta africana (strain ATCC 700263 / DSM 8902 / Z-7692) TaxID=889378 RepID=H9UHU0_SPIAZ|nr:TetR/AcrR family transcriptional regulator [Spirochaeta africana]AFG37083.1 transcriptional regulator [Spirochaeta africana DSM 8902]
METKRTEKVSLVSRSADQVDEQNQEPDPLRTRILEGADDLAMNDGLQELTMDRLARHMAMSKKTLYTCFRSKNELVEALISHIFSGVGESLVSIRTCPDLSTGEKLARTRDIIVKRVNRIGARLIDDLARVFPELWRRVDARRTELLQEHFRILLREGVANGSVRDTIDIDMMVMLIVRTISRVGRPQELIYEPYSLRDIVSGLLSLLCTGVLTPDGMQAYHGSEPEDTNSQHPDSG